MLNLLKNPDNTGSGAAGERTTDLQDENCYPVSLKVNAQHLNF